MTVIEIVTMESAEGKQLEFTLVHHELFIINVSLYTTTSTTTTTTTTNTNTTTTTKFLLKLLNHHYYYFVISFMVFVMFSCKLN